MTKMKTIILLLNISLIGIQSVAAQTKESEKINVKINNEFVDLKLYPNPVEDVLRLKSTKTIDFIRLFNKQGELVTQLTPENNEVALDEIQEGFYLVCIYIGNKEVKRRILKKM